MASYSDKGSKEQPKLNPCRQEIKIFKFQNLKACNADEKAGGLSNWE